MTDERREAEELVVAARQAMKTCGSLQYEDMARAVVRLVLKRALKGLPPDIGRTGNDYDSGYNSAVREANAAILALIPQAPTEGGE